MAVDLQKLFGKFAGKELQKGADQTVFEMTRIASKNGLRLRVLFPGQGYDESIRSDRVTVETEATANGRYRISSIKNV